MNILADAVSMNVLLAREINKKQKEWGNTHSFFLTLILNFDKINTKD